MYDDPIKKFKQEQNQINLNEIEEWISQKKSSFKVKCQGDKPAEISEKRFLENNLKLM